MLYHRQRRRFALPQTVCEQFRQLLGGGGEQREFGNKVRRFCQQQPPDFGKLGQLVVGDRRHSRSVSSAAPKRSSSRIRKPNSGAASGAIAAVLDEPVDRERLVGINR